MGQATARALRELLPQTEILGENCGNAESLSDFIISERKSKKSSKPLLFLCGNQRRDVLPERLAASGIEFEEHVVYCTEPASNLSEKLELACSKQIPRVIVFFSPSGVAAVAEILRLLFPDALTTIKFIAIGPTTASAIRSHSLIVHAVASKPTATHVLQAIRTVL